jgi:uncharacterized coiled-coil protein SlyX
MAPPNNQDEARFNKLEEAITKMSDVASDMSKMLAVHEQRLNQQEKLSDSIGSKLEKRNDEVDKKFDQVYDAIKAGDDAIITEMKKIAEIRAGQLFELNEKISKLEKWRWMVVGGAMAAGYGLSLFFNLLKFIH